MIIIIIICCFEASFLKLEAVLNKWFRFILSCSVIAFIHWPSPTLASTDTTEDERNDILFSFYLSLESQDFVDAASHLEALQRINAMTKDTLKKAVKVYTLAAQQIEPNASEIASDYYMRAANLLNLDTEKYERLELLKKSVVINPDNSKAVLGYQDLQTELTNQLHHSAHLALRHHDLEQAIKFWQQAVYIDVNYQPARKMLHKTQRMKQNLIAIQNM